MQAYSTWVQLQETGKDTVGNNKRRERCSLQGLDGTAMKEKEWITVANKDSCRNRQIVNARM